MDRRSKDPAKPKAADRSVRSTHKNAQGFLRLGPAGSLQAVAVRRYACQPAERGGEMALIGKSASQRNLGNLQVSAAQEGLRSRNADTPHIFADRAAEMAMELAADLDGMPPDTT